MQEKEPSLALRRGLKNRHLQMIALGGAIGTGLFYGSASTIALAGPAVMLAYLLGGVTIFRAFYPAGTTGSTTSSSPWQSLRRSASI